MATNTWRRFPAAGATALALVLPAAPAAAAQRTLESITREEFEEVKQFVARMDREPQPAPKDLEPKYAASKAPVPVGEAELAAAVARFKDAFFFNGISFNSVTLEGDAFLLPNWKQATIDASLPEVVAREGKPVKLAPPDTSDLFAQGRVDNDGRFEQRFKLAQELDEDDVEAATARVKLRLPATVAQVEAKCGDTARKTGGAGMWLQVVRCERNLLVALAPPKLQDPVVEVFDDTGRVLETNSRSSEPVFAGGKRIKDLSYEERTTPEQAAELKILAQGRAAGVRLVSVVKHAELEFRTAVRPRGEHEKPATREKPRYMPDVELQFASFTEKQLRSLITFRWHESEALMSRGAPTVVATLPRVGNLQYADVEYEKVKAFDAAGKALKFEVENGSIDEDEGTTEVRVMPAGDTRGPVPAVRVEGVLKLKFPLQMKVSSFKGGGAQDDLSAELEGNLVKLRSESGDLRIAEPRFGQEALDGVRAYDATGMRLRKLNWMSSGDGETSFAFWGPVAEARVTTIGKQVELKIPFKVKKGK